MKVAWASNAPWCGTGYGQQTALVVDRLAGDGHEVSVLANYGLAGSSTHWNSPGGHRIKILPQGFTAYSDDIIPSHAENVLGGEPGDGWLITLFDVWVFQNPRYQRFNTACWVPVDHRPAPAPVVSFLRESFSVPIAMSRFGEQQLARAGLQPLYAPHGVDCNIFTPGDQATARERFGLPGDGFVVVMNSANKEKGYDRKSFFESFTAVSALMQQHDDVVLHVHSERHGIGGGHNLEELADAVGIPEDRLFFTDQYAYRLGLSPEVLADLYRCGDVLLAPSKGEGFGIPVIEAQACGVPVIVSDFSAQPELVGDGWTVAGEPLWDGGQQSTFWKPSIGSIIDALGQAYDQADGEPSERARLHAEKYDADLVHRVYWRPIMTELEQRMGTIAPIDAGKVKLSRAERRRLARKGAA
jgi:glycosyltransferase involved in cell wall biosynthesis